MPDFDATFLIPVKRVIADLVELIKEDMCHTLTKDSLHTTQVEEDRVSKMIEEVLTFSKSSTSPSPRDVEILSYITGSTRPIAWFLSSERKVARKGFRG